MTMTDPIHDAYESAHRGRDGADRPWSVPVRLEFDVRVDAANADEAAELVGQEFTESFEDLLDGFHRDDIALTTGIPSKIGHYDDH